MKRALVFASHNTLAKGLKETVEFFAGKGQKIEVITAYLDNQSIDQEIQNVMSKIEGFDEIVVLTDLLSGSVNQAFYKRINSSKIHLIAGFNLSLALALTLEPNDKPLSAERIETLIEQSREQIVYVNNMKVEKSEDDE